MIAKHPSKLVESRASTSMERSASGSKSGRATNNFISEQLSEPLPPVLASKSKYIKELARDPFIPAKKLAFESTSILVKEEETSSLLPAANPSYGDNEFADDGFADDGFADDGFADDDPVARSTVLAMDTDPVDRALPGNSTVRAGREGFADDSDPASPEYAAAARVGTQAQRENDNEGFADEEELAGGFDVAGGEENGFADDEPATGVQVSAVSSRKKQAVGVSSLAASEDQLEEATLAKVEQGSGEAGSEEQEFADDSSPRLVSTEDGYADDDVEAMEVEKMLEVAAPVSPEEEGYADDDDDDTPLWKLAPIKSNVQKPAPPPPKRKIRPPPPPPPKRPSLDKGRSVSASSSRPGAPRKSSTPMDVDHEFADGSASPPSSEFADDISITSSRSRSPKKSAPVAKIVTTPTNNISALGSLGSYKIPRMPKNVDGTSAGQALATKGPRIDLSAQAAPNKKSPPVPLTAPPSSRNPPKNQQLNGHPSPLIASASALSAPLQPATALPPPQPVVKTASSQALPLSKPPAPPISTDPRRRKPLNSDPHNNGFAEGSSPGSNIPLNSSLIYQKFQTTDLFRRELMHDPKASRIHGEGEEVAITKLCHHWDIPNLTKNFYDFREVMGAGTSEVRESWIYAPKKDGGGSNAKKVLADYYGLQLILSKLEGVKQTKVLEESTRAVFVHVSEEEEIRKVLAIKNPALVKLEQFRNKDVIFVLFGEKTFKQFWRKG